jgi:uncharacterized protein (TIGR03000 family)
MPPYTLHGYNQGGTFGYGPPVVYADPRAVYGNVTNPGATTVPGTTSPMTSPMTPPDAKPTGEPRIVDPNKKPGMGANLKFRLPADAKLYVDGRLTLVEGTERAFTTPPLLVGQKFYYEVKAELMVDGAVVVEEKRVVIESGSELTESFSKLFAAASRGKPTVVAEK